MARSFSAGPRRTAAQVYRGHGLKEGASVKV
jgi:hypothetical protein